MTLEGVTMLRFPKHGTIAVDLHLPLGQRAPAEIGETDRRLLSFRDAMTRGLVSAVVVVVLVIVFLL